MTIVSAKPTLELAARDGWTWGARGGGI
jgi:hypothetical protein